MKCGTGIHGAKRMNPTDSGNTRLTFAVLRQMYSTGFLLVLTSLKLTQEFLFLCILILMYKYLYDFTICHSAIRWSSVHIWEGLGKMWCR